MTVTTTAEARPATLTNDLWAAGAPIYDQILNHPFLTELTSGELTTDRFTYYLAQDGHYLRQYARALSILAGRAPDPATTAMFATHATSAIAAELQTHAELLAQLGADAPSDEPSPTTVAYTSYVLSVTQGGSFAEGVAAVLPCYWIYWAVGTELLQRPSPNETYARWIETYASPEFSELVHAALELTDTLSDTVTPAEREQLTERFRTASKYEWMFWDAAYRKETWPV